MRKIGFACLLAFAASHGLAASEAEQQANSFANIYASTCLKHLNDLSVLRDKLKSVPKFPADQAAQFLNDSPGDAWPVPDKYGSFVLALPAAKNMCMVFARRADAAEAEKQFMTMVEKAPAPLTAKQVRNSALNTSANGPTHTLSYEWSVSNASRKMLFTLTTARSDKAQLQVLGSAAIVTP